MLESSATKVDVFLSVGSNIAPEENLRMACRELTAGYGELNLSSVYRNKAVGFEGGDFLNMVVAFNTAVAPEQILTRIKQLHVQAGREYQESSFCSRTLDLDILLYGDMVRKRLKLPHQDLDKYGFVLQPMVEVAPELQHPVSGKTMSQLWDGFDAEKHHMQKVDIGIN
ncbi:MAG: 2-amino-4-hydroxy-6-hydroxymethyldihydropteridine diphosphokinase [Gammaproteobacteria bacterium]|nr:2-amino-4-hydroxy-6-hydroxymethyldihydropteridine diphosphokinase [Gammaproteobacteria bacterium]MCP4088526.1 2-amino-4-hydroxy-6-hydroxymethyldihydropteridine diphosphokinase [Gammaproteobacteria bacterium]MCP4276734.1 2-amino-4-hydroxy-6-hydroxymethyldihydropteridine diphosphokinase [Gammaproteobacteria bacterium]MCP4833055.1 2-amino-4-hydroxy-6-hydroxymethyldihydropteridine diphosphokinase [Gammaproteobacteria bacterium]MCP4928386.1 2-amino-4-hydroxy-6-hydroxymethyldihydropteridine diphos